MLEVDGMVGVDAGDAVTGDAVGTPQRNGVKRVNRRRTDIQLSAIVEIIGLDQKLITQL